VHYATWFFLAAALIHAWTFWYFAAGGLALYALDKLARVYNAANCVERMTALSNSSGITKITVSATILKSSNVSLVGPRHLPGQFAFVHIPAVDALQWHPFTISSAPADAEGSITFHVQDQGRGTWTRALAELAHAHAATECGQLRSCSSPRAPLPLIAIDGPYGCVGNFNDEHSIAVYVAGGIGVTPFASILKARLACAQRRVSNQLVQTAPREVHLVWVVRSAALFAEFDDLLSDLSNVGSDAVLSIRISLHLFVTQLPISTDSEIAFGSDVDECSSLLVSASSSAATCESTATSSNTSVSLAFPASRATTSPKDHSSAAKKWRTAVKPGRPDLAAIFSAIASSVGCISAPAAAASAVSDAESRGETAAGALTHADTAIGWHGRYQAAASASVGASGDGTCTSSASSLSFSDSSSSLPVSTVPPADCWPIRSGQQSDKVLVVACGPPTLSAEAARLAAVHSFSFQSERFLF
jgi:hypothetical protein